MKKINRINRINRINHINYIRHTVVHYTTNVRPTKKQKRF